MPNVDMESCVTTALRLFKETPPSLYTKKTVDSVFYTPLYFVSLKTWLTGGNWPECISLVGKADADSESEETHGTKTVS